MRGNSRPFGGIQLIFSGDFFQLPPVGQSDDPDTQRFCFESEDWNLVFSKSCQIELLKIFRQKDEVYAAILNQIREGKIKRRYNDLLLEYVEREKPGDLIVEPTKLYPTKNKVEQINQFKMMSLNTEERVYKIRSLKELEMNKTDQIKRKEFTDKDVQFEFEFLAGNLICEKEFKLKIGAQVMCIINIKSGEGDVLICNGSQGIVQHFCETTGFPVVKYNNGVTMTMSPHTWTSEKIPGMGVSQVPLILSWAMTIHKSQGASLDAAEIDVGSGIFECGQTYVALSRVKSLGGLYLTSFDATKIKINKKVKKFYEDLRFYNESHNSKEKNESFGEVYEDNNIPVAVAVTIANPVDFIIAESKVMGQIEELVQSGEGESNNNPFIRYQYVFDQNQRPIS
jgi:ATP-dependent DNA helicase PIF1